MDLNNEIEKLYKSDSINQMIDNLFSSRFPDHLKQDLKQELFVELLNTDKERANKLFESGEIKFYCTRVIINMSSNTGKFYNKYLISESKIKEYVLSTYNESLPYFDLSKLKPALEYLNKKNLGSASDLHEYILFKKYIDLKSCDKVANYFSIPRLHVYSVVSKVKKELKKIIKNA
jgi:hypothetical protein